MTWNILEGGGGGAGGMGGGENNVSLLKLIFGPVKNTLG